MDKNDKDKHNDKIITIVDAGLGNLGSVRRAVEHIGATPNLVSSPEGISQARHLILPGVGAFRDGMEGLRERGLIDPIRDYAKSGRPLFGICLGMQMLFSQSEEFGEWDGLDLIPGRVVGMEPVERVNLPGYKVPLIGWNSIKPARDGAWRGTFLGSTTPGTEVYFVHSFFAKTKMPEDVLAVQEYGGQTMCAAAKRRNVMGTQFHPEKSGEVGIAMLSAFCGLP